MQQTHLNKQKKKHHTIIIPINTYPVSSINAKVILEKTRFCVWDPVIASFWKLQVTISKLLKNQYCKKTPALEKHFILEPRIQGHRSSSPFLL